LIAQILCQAVIMSIQPYQGTQNPMILIGQYDSPFTRRVAIALRLYGLAFEHRPWSTFGEGDKIAPFNPLRRVPTLVFEDGEVLIESTAILDYLDEVVGPSKAMIAENGPERRHALKICALATGLGDKAVSLVYERVLRKDASKLWVERCEAQIGGVLDALESERAAIPSVTPTSRSPACFDSPPRPIPACSPPHAIRHCSPTPRAAKRCRRLWRSCSR
jgi:Glutathione S-transferase, N-terminal domain